MDAFEILVIILSVSLFLFLTLAIALVIILIKIARSINRVTNKAASIVDNVEAAGQVMRDAANKASVTRSVVNIVEAIVDRQKSK